MKFATKPIQHHPSHRRHVATLAWEIKNSNFLQIYSAIIPDMEENANKLHFKCANEFLYTCNCVYLCVFIEILYSSLNTMSIADKHCSDVCCDEFLMPQIDRKSKHVKEQ